MKKILLNTIILLILPLLFQQADAQTGTTVKKESAEAVCNFLKWYKKNYTDITKLSLVDYQGYVKDTMKYYAVNFKGTEAYLQMLKSSGYISDKYINSWRSYFSKHDSLFRKNPQNEGPPEGFEYDFVLVTQEIDWAMRAIDAPEIVDVQETATTAVVKINIYMHLKFTLSKNAGKWEIDKIENRGLRD